MTHFVSVYTVLGPTYSQFHAFFCACGLVFAHRNADIAHGRTQDHFAESNSSGRHVNEDQLQELQLPLS
jgi:hypothetical protein